MSGWDGWLILLAASLIVFFTLWGGRVGKRVLRPIEAFEKLRRTIELSVEDGSRLQISLGRGDPLGPQAAAGLAGLTLLRQVARIAADSDQPPIATTGDAGLMVLAQDTLRVSYRDLNIRSRYHGRLGRFSGATPFSYAAGVASLILDRSVSAGGLVGSFGEEAGLIAAASQRAGAFSLGGSDSLVAQSILYSSADEPLLGEEIYATGAYLDAGAGHLASLLAQDILRWLVIAVIFGLAIGRLIGWVQ